MHTVEKNLIHLDLNHNWHPCSQMKDYEYFKPLLVKRAEGSEIELQNGKKIIDAISSWWCKSLGHQHPRLKAALQKQIDYFEHVLFVNTTNETIIHLSQKLAALTPALTKIFYAGDGSCAVEIALKMSMQAQQIKGESQRTHFIALENAYHGETIGAMSVSDLEIYNKAFNPLLFKSQFITSIPYVHTTSDPLWKDCSACWEKIVMQLVPLAKTAIAIIVEPIVQGASGMKIYSADFLYRLRKWAAKNDIYFICDEIMTGIGRTGKMLASEYANIVPDFVCLSKGLTAGWLPFSAVLTSNDIYDLFYDDYATGKAFMHSHTYSGHVLGAAIALEVLQIMEEENICTRANQLGEYMWLHFQEIALQTKKLQNIRQVGAIIAADLIVEKEKRLGYTVYQEAIARGAFLRPLGNTIYWLPPLNTDYAVIDRLASITQAAIYAAYGDTPIALT